MAQGPSDTILVAIRITLRIRESKVRNPDPPDRRRFVLSERILVCVCEVIVVSSVMSYESLSYTSYTLGAYTYPHWANVVGWLIAVSSMMAVPAVAVYQLITLPASTAKQVRRSVIGRARGHVICRISRDLSLDQSRRQVS